MSIKKKLDHNVLLACKDINEFKQLLLSSGFIADKDKDHSHFDCLFQGLLIEHKLYSPILKDPALSLEEKQGHLNDLNLAFLKDLNAVQFYVPKSLLNWIYFIDSISRIKEARFLKHSYLIYLWNKSKNISSVEPACYSLRSSDKTIFLNKLIFVFKICNYLNHSIGLMLAHSISKSAFKAVTQFSKLGHSSFHTNSSGQRILHKSDFSEDTYLEIEKTSLLSSISKDFLSQVPSFLKLCRKKIDSKINSKGKDHLSSIEKDLLILLEDKSNHWVATDEDQALFCEQLGLYFEFQTDLFHCTLKPIMKSIKHTYVYVLSSSFIKALFVLKKESFQLPHLLPLDDWVYTNKPSSFVDSLNYNNPECFTLHSGGPSFLSSPAVSAFIQSRHNSFSFAKQNDLDALNYMKNQRFKINVNFLNVILASIPYYLLVFLYKIHPSPNEATYLDHERIRDCRLLEYGVLNLVNPTTCELRTLGEYLNLDPNLKKLIKNFSEEPEGEKKELLSNRILFVKKELVKGYLDALILIRTFFHTLFIASSFSNLSFFFNVNLDFRGRFYYLVFPLGVQNSNLGASLFEIDLAGFDFNNQNSFNNNLLLNTYISSLKPLKDFFTARKFELKMNFPVIGLDVTCSGLQIISALIGFEKGLLLTNLLYNPSDEKDTKRDLYSDIRNLFFSSIPLDLTINDLNLKENVEENSLDNEKTFSKLSKNEEFYKRAISRLPKANDKKINQSIDLVLFINKNPTAVKNILACFKNILSRNVIKYWAMRLVYSEGSRSRAVELMSFYSEQIDSFPLAPRKLIFKIALFLSELFKTTLFSNYLGFGDFVEFCQANIVSKKALDANKGVWLTCSDTHLEVFFTQFKNSSKRYYHNDRLNNIISFSYNLKSESIDYDGHSRSLLPNFIHFLDSRLLSLILVECKKKSIPLYCNHDCFYVPIIFGEEIKNIYFKCFKNLFFETDCLSSFFESNNVSPDIYKPFILIINERKNLILSKINSNCLLPSFFVLS